MAAGPPLFLAFLLPMSLAMDFRWHDLRHTWATWQRQAGVPTHELQRLGGWRTGAMVERYAHLAPDQLSGAAARLNGILPGYDLAAVPGKGQALNREKCEKPLEKWWVVRPFNDSLKALV